MKTNPLKEGALTKNSAGLGIVTGEMVRERAVELAAMNGRTAPDVSLSEVEQAKQELTGKQANEGDQAILEGIPESERWDPAPASKGHMMRATAGEDEDAEGRSDNEQLVVEGIAGAEEDHRREASQQAPDESAE